MNPQPASINDRTASAQLLPQHGFAIREAALLMGASPEQAELFATCGVAPIDDQIVGVHGLGDAGPYRWCLVAPVERPEGVEEGVWLDALLHANGQLMLLGEWTFGLDAEGGALLLMALSKDDEDPGILAVHLRGVLEIIAALRRSVTRSTDADEPSAPAVNAATPEAAEVVSSRAQVMESLLAVPESLRQWLRGAMLHMGVEVALADQIAASGSIDFTDVDVELALDLDETTLVATAALGSPSDEDLSQRCAALSLNGTLLLSNRFSLARSNGAPQLIGRLPVGEHVGAELAEWLTGFAGVGRALKLQTPAAAH